MFSKTVGYCIASILLLQLAVANATPAAQTINGRIVGGTPATISNFPYVVQIRVDNSFICGGTLITPLFVVSAAHCFTNARVSQILVVGGATHLTDVGVHRKVEKILRPSTFNLNTMTPDVAVLKLHLPLTGKNIGTIGLCTEEVKAGTMMTVSGWGTTSENANKVSNQLMTVNVPVTARATCAKQYQNVVKLTSTMFCASQPGTKDSCSGDSGGPGVVNGKLCGIVSFGVGCARKNFAGVYTSVLSVKKFIENSKKF